MGSNYYNKCGSCSHLNPNEKSGFKYYCDVRHSYYPLDDKICTRYDYDKYRDYDELYRMDNPSGCYITTIICEILKLPDNHPMLMTLRNFRDNILQKDCQYIPILLEYDVIGPKIAELLKTDSNRLRICRDLIFMYLGPIITYLEMKNYMEALNLYKQMVTSLKEMYGISATLVSDENYDYSHGGHGQLVKKY